MAMLSQHVTQAPPRPSECGVELPPEVEALILSMLAKAPEDRPTADEVRTRLAALRKVEDEPPRFAAVVGPQPASRSEPLLIPRDPLRWRAALVGVTAAVAISSGLAVDWPHRRSAPQRSASGTPAPRHEPAAKLDPPAPPAALASRPSHPAPGASRRARERAVLVEVEPQPRPKHDAPTRDPQSSLDYLIDHAGAHR